MSMVRFTFDLTPAAASLLFDLLREDIIDAREKSMPLANHSESEKEWFASHAKFITDEIWAKMAAGNKAVDVEG